MAESAERDAARFFPNRQTLSLGSPGRRRTTKAAAFVRTAVVAKITAFQVIGKVGIESALKGIGFDEPGEKELTMLWTIAVILVIMWALGMVTSYTLGGFIHLLLVLAIITILIRVIQGRSPV